MLVIIHIIFIVMIQFERFSSTIDLILNFSPNNFNFNEINKDKPVYILCHSGVRSAQACLYLEQKGFDAANVLGGIHAWATEIDSSVPIY